MSSVRVLFVLDELKFSGAEVMLKKALPVWEERGIQCEILSKGERGGPYRSVLEDSGFNTFHISSQNIASFLKRYRGLILRREYDAINIHTEHLNFWLGLVAVIEGTPVVARTVNSVCNYGGKSRFKRVVQRALLRLLGVKHISISRTVEETEREFLYNPTRIIQNWYDDNTFVPPDPSERERARRKYQVRDNEFVIVSVGNCHEVKNHKAILRALAQLDDTNLKYLHAGEEQEGHPERKLASELGVRDQVRFLGLVEDVVQVLYAGDAFIMPSLREGAGIAAREAMGSGLVCLATGHFC